MRILVVDDDPQLNKLVATMFEQIGETQVDCAVDGHEGLERLDRETYGLVLLDLNMPAMNGVDFVVAMGLHQPGVPCIFVTAAADEMIQMAMNVAREAGVKMLGTLRKPFNQQQLEGMFRQVQAA
ncbi:MAG: response regulator [Thiohalophilus sp.]